MSLSGTEGWLGKKPRDGSAHVNGVALGPAPEAGTLPGMQRPRPGSLLASLALLALLGAGEGRADPEVTPCSVVRLLARPPDIEPGPRVFMVLDEGEPKPGFRDAYTTSPGGGWISRRKWTGRKERVQWKTLGSLEVLLRDHEGEPRAPRRTTVLRDTEEVKTEIRGLPPRHRVPRFRLDPGTYSVRVEDARLGPPRVLEGVEVEAGERVILDVGGGPEEVGLLEVIPRFGLTSNLDHLEDYRLFEAGASPGSLPLAEGRGLERLILRPGEYELVRFKDTELPMVRTEEGTYRKVQLSGEMLGRFPLTVHAGKRHRLSVEPHGMLQAAVPPEMKRAGISRMRVEALGAAAQVYAEPMSVAAASTRLAAGRYSVVALRGSFAEVGEDVGVPRTISVPPGRITLLPFGPTGTVRLELPALPPWKTPARVRVTGRGVFWSAHLDDDGALELPVGSYKVALDMGVKAPRPREVVVREGETAVVAYQGADRALLEVLEKAPRPPFYLEPPAAEEEEIPEVACPELPACARGGAASTTDRPGCLLLPLVAREVREEGARRVRIEPSAPRAAYREGLDPGLRGALETEARRLVEALAGHASELPPEAARRGSVVVTGPFTDLVFWEGIQPRVAVLRPASLTSLATGPPTVPLAMAFLTRPTTTTSDAADLAVLAEVPVETLFLPELAEPRVVVSAAIPAETLGVRLTSVSTRGAVLTSMELVLGRSEEDPRRYLGPPIRVVMPGAPAPEGDTLVIEAEPGGSLGLALGAPTTFPLQELPFEAALRDGGEGVGADFAAALREAAGCAAGDEDPAPDRVVIPDIRGRVRFALPGMAEKLGGPDGRVPLTLADQAVLLLLRTELVRLLEGMDAELARHLAGVAGRDGRSAVEDHRAALEVNLGLARELGPCDLLGPEDGSAPGLLQLAGRSFGPLASALLPRLLRRDPAGEIVPDREAEAALWSLAPLLQALEVFEESEAGPGPAAALEPHEVQALAMAAALAAGAGGAPMDLALEVLESTRARARPGSSLTSGGK